MSATDGYGNTPWGGNIIPGVTPTDGYGPMGWGNGGAEPYTPKPIKSGGLVRGHDGHLVHIRPKTHRERP